MRRKLTRSRKLASLLSLILASNATAEIVELSTIPIDASNAGTSEPQPTMDFNFSDFRGEIAAEESADSAELPLVALTQAQVPAAQPPALAPPTAPNLPTSPNVPINQLAPPALPPTTGNFGGALPTTLGATAGSYSAAPNMIGDIFGGGFSVFSGSQTVNFADYAAGTILNQGMGGGPGSANSILAFEFGTDIVPNDIFTTGTGLDTVGGGDGADTFSISEPIPPSDAMTAPGPGFVFDGGTAVFTGASGPTTAQAGVYNDGDLWYIKYSYTSTINSGSGGSSGSGVRSFIPVPGPGVSARRVKISENFSPEVRDRFFLSYSFFNDAFGGLGDISRYILGTERVLVDELISIEARLPMAGTYGSFQAIDRAESRSYELGNASLIAKAVLLRNQRLLLSSGVGMTIPTADDTILTAANREILRIENETFHILPFLGVQRRMSEKSALQGYLQLDIAANGDPVLANLTGGTLANLGTFTDSTLLHADVAANRRIYQNRRANFLRAVIANAEIHYTGTLQDSDIVSQGGLNYTNLKSNFSIVNTTLGLQFQLGDRMIVTPAFAIPLRTGLDQQFDYEAIVQLNYLR